MTEQQLFDTSSYKMCTALGINYGFESEKYPFVKIQYNPAVSYTLLPVQFENNNTYQDENGVMIKVQETFEVPESRVAMFRYNHKDNEASSWLREHSSEDEMSTLTGYAGYCGRLALDNSTDVLMVTSQIHDLDAGAVFIPIDLVNKIEMLKNETMRKFLIDTEEDFRKYYLPLAVDEEGNTVMKRELTYEETEKLRKKIMKESYQEYETVYWRTL